MTGCSMVLVNASAREEPHKFEGTTASGDALAEFSRSSQADNQATTLLRLQKTTPRSGTSATIR